MQAKQRSVQIMLVSPSPPLAVPPYHPLISLSLCCACQLWQQSPRAAHALQCKRPQGFLVHKRSPSYTALPIDWVHAGGGKEQEQGRAVYNRVFASEFSVLARGGWQGGGVASYECHWTWRICANCQCQCGFLVLFGSLSVCLCVYGFFGLTANISWLTGRHSLLTTHTHTPPPLGTPLLPYCMSVLSCAAYWMQNAWNDYVCAAHQQPGGWERKRWQIKVLYMVDICQFI